MEQGREVERLVSSHSDLKQKAEQQSKELFDVYGSLRRKEEVLRNMEDRLNRKIADREEQCLAMQSKLNSMEHTFSRDNDSMEQLRQFCREKDQMGENLQSILQHKEMQIRDMKLELQ